MTVDSALQQHNGYSFEGVAELIAVEKYFREYNRDIVSKMSSYLKNARSVLEFGAGIGTLALEWKAQTGIAPQCLEIYENQLKILKERGFECYKSIEEISHGFQGIYTSNVLEHIENDEETLCHLYSLLNKDSIMVIYVPAFMCLFSQMDSAVGHYRRYGKKELLDKVKRAGFKPLECYFVDSIGFFACLYLRLFGYKRNQDFMYAKHMKLYDRLLYPVSRIFDRLGLRYLFGKNILLVALKE